MQSLTVQARKRHGDASRALRSLSLFSQVRLQFTLQCRAVLYFTSLSTQWNFECLRCSGTPLTSWKKQCSHAARMWRQVRCANVTGRLWEKCSKCPTKWTWMHVHLKLFLLFSALLSSLSDTWQAFIFKLRLYPLLSFISPTLSFTVDFLLPRQHAPSRLARDCIHSMST